jgi:hypothetical protein
MADSQKIPDFSIKEISGFFIYLKCEIDYTILGFYFHTAF